MKLSSDDPRLSAYLLGELPLADAAKVEHAVAADPALRLSLDELRRVASLLEGSLSTAAPALRPAQREAVLRAVRHAGQAGNVVEFASARRGLRPWATVLGSAAAVVLAVTLASRISGPRQSGEGGAGGGGELALLPMPGPAGESGGAVAPGGGGGGDSATAAARVTQREELQKAPGAFLDKVSRQLGSHPLPDPARLPALKPLPPLLPSGEIGLPVIVGHASYGWVRGWVRERVALPPEDAVRLEELVNTFPLDRQDGEGIEPRIETAVAPWNPDSILIAATLRGREQGDTAVSWSFEAAEGVQVRLIASPGSDAGKLPDRLPAGRAVTVLLEVAPAANSSRLGVLKWEIDGEFTGRIVEASSTVVSPGMRQLGLMAAFGMWLRGEGVEAAAMEEILRQAGGDQDPGRADSRRLVRQALDVAAGGR